MPMVIDDKHLKVEGCIVVWNGITRPDATDSGQKWNLRVVLPSSSPDLPLLEMLAQTQLAEGQFKGVLPPGGNMPCIPVQPTEFGGMFPGHVKFSAGTTLGAPDVYSEYGQLLDPMQYGTLIYTGQRVDLLVHAFEYNNRQKGVGLGLDGFAIIASANAPQLNLGSSIDTSAVFGGGSVQHQPAMGGSPSVQPPMQQQQQQYVQQPMQQPQYVQQQPQYVQQPMGGSPAPQGVVTQAHNMLPQ